MHTHRSVLVADEAGVCVGGVGGQAAVEGARDVHGGAAPLLHTLHTHTVAPGDRGRQPGTQGTALGRGGEEEGEGTYKYTITHLKRSRMALVTYSFIASSTFSMGNKA